ncbi:MAG: tetratricopeptide repeat protein [Verrucomicrobiota bacterium]|nr:tetratricopeptide repeat protein [Verrucomicrobiota bacterium]
MNPTTLFATLLSLILGVGCGKKEPELTPIDTANRPEAKSETPKFDQLKYRNLLEVFEKLGKNKDEEFDRILKEARAKADSSGAMTYEDWSAVLKETELSKYFKVPRQMEGADTNRAILRGLEHKAGLDLKGGSQFVIELKVDGLDDPEGAVNQAMNVLRRRVDRFGVAEPVIQNMGGNKIIIQIVGIPQTKREEIKRHIQRVASLRFQLVDVDSQGREVEYQPGIIVPGSTNLIDKFTAEDGKQIERQVMVETKVQMGSEHVTRAFAARDPLSGAPVINFSLDATGAGIFHKVTSGNIGRGLAIVLVELKEDGSELHELISAPTIQSAIGARGEITGIDTHSEAREIANVLENPLSTPLKIIEERDVVNTDNLDGSNGHSSNLMELLPPIGPVWPAGVMAAWFFTSSDPADRLQRGQGSTTTVGQQQVLINAHTQPQRGQGGTMTVGQQQVLIEVAVQYWQRTGQLPRRASDMLGAADLDGDGNRDVGELVLKGAIRQDLLERTVGLDIQFDDDAINSIIREQLSLPQGQFQRKIYDQLIQSFGEADLRQYFHDELAIRHLHQVMGLGGGMVSRRAIRPLVEQSLLKYDTEVAVFRASEYTNKVTNVTERLVEYYTNNKATYKEDDRVKFAWLKISIPTNAANQTAIKQARQYQAAVYQGFQQHGTNITVLSQIAANLQPPLKIERIELDESNVTGHPLGSVFNQVRSGDLGDIRLPVVRGPEGLYFAGVEEEIEGSLPKFNSLTSKRSNEVRLAFLKDETHKLAREAGRAFYTNLTTALTEGNQTFDKFCRANKVEVFTVPLFSSTTQPNDPAYAALTNRVELPELQRAIHGMDPSKEKIPVDRITEFNTNPYGGWMLNLKQRVPAESEEIEAELNGRVLAQRRRGLGQATQPHPVRNFSQQGFQMAASTFALSQRQLQMATPTIKFGPSANHLGAIILDVGQPAFQMADPTWSFRQAELSKLKLYIEAKKDRSEEIGKELEALGNQLLNLTRRGNLEREREIISQAITRLKELQQDKSKLHPFTPQKQWNKTAAKKAGAALEATNVAGRQIGVVPPDSYRAVMNQHPNSSAGRRAWLLWARGLLDAGDYQDAQKQFEGFLSKNEKNPMAPGAKLGRALCLDELNKTDEAKAKYDQIIKDHPGELVAQYAMINLAALHQEDGQLEMAQKLYRELIEGDLTFFEKRGPMSFMVRQMGSQRLASGMARSLYMTLLEKNPQLLPETSNPPIPPTVPTVPKSNTTKLPDNNDIVPQLKTPPLKARDTKGVEKSK